MYKNFATGICRLMSPNKHYLYDKEEDVAYNSL